MAAIAMTRPLPPHRASTGMASLGSAVGLDVDIDEIDGQPAQSLPQTPSPMPIPNKHIPMCPPGPPVASTTPSPSPPPSEPDRAQQSLLFPPDDYLRMQSGDLSLYSIDPAGVAAALDYIASQPLPDPSLVFPWLHGIHPSNLMQQAFFSQRRRVMRKTPRCIRGLTVVKADGQLGRARLKGAIAPEEFMETSLEPKFIDADPKEGFSVRNFHIQTAKTAATSDIIVYGDDEAAVRQLGWDIAAAQESWHIKYSEPASPLPEYNTFICVADFSEFEECHPQIVSIDSDGQLTGNVVNFFHQERKEMYAMTVASEISHNVWLGPTPDPDSGDEDAYTILIECSDMGHLNPRLLRSLAETDTSNRKIYLDFPSSGTILPPTWSQIDADAILESCKWIYHLANGTTPSKLASPMNDLGGAADMYGLLDELSAVPSPRERKILIHCADGYTESTMLGLAYYSYSHGIPIHDAWLSMHTTKQRNFFAYQTDVALLTALAPRLMSESPVNADKDIETMATLVHSQPRWFSLLDGSLPSRVLDYMYLGNLTHANNPELLKALGITQILSVGEMATWREQSLEEWGEENLCVVQGVQDNGIDPLTHEFARCLDFIGKSSASLMPLKLHVY